jgi:hypothetical protein
MIYITLGKIQNAWFFKDKFSGFALQAARPEKAQVSMRRINSPRIIL